MYIIIFFSCFYLFLTSLVVNFISENVCITNFNILFFEEIKIGKFNSVCCQFTFLNSNWMKKYNACNYCGGWRGSRENSSGCMRGCEIVHNELLPRRLPCTLWYDLVEWHGGRSFFTRRQGHVRILFCFQYYVNIMQYRSNKINVTVNLYVHVPNIFIYSLTRLKPIKNRNNSIILWTILVIFVEML